MTNILSIQDLRKSFNGLTPLKDICMSVDEKEIVLITGENGAGKTTLFNLITRLERPSDGYISFLGKRIDMKTPLEIARLGITRLYQQPRLFRTLSVVDNIAASAPYTLSTNFMKLALNARSAGKEDRELKEKAQILLTKFGLEGIAGQKAGELSFGQQKLVSFCMVAIRGTRLALLDEPFAGVNPQTAHRLVDMILQLRSEGVTFMIIEHNVDKCLTFVDTHLEIRNGLAVVLRKKQQDE